jgi:hypothetical protein
MLLFACAHVFFLGALTTWGIAYFASEKLVILQLVFREFALSRKP